MSLLLLAPVLLPPWPGKEIFVFTSPWVLGTRRSDLKSEGMEKGDETNGYLIVLLFVFCPLHKGALMEARPLSSQVLLEVV